MNFFRQPLRTKKILLLCLLGARWESPAVIAQSLQRNNRLTELTGWWQYMDSTEPVRLSLS